ncbi:DMT family transporter [Phenylobacterium sp.]|uniref:DMT family transporter n=1 Tax=Phenylobacterium sp. TaxID=1871053 RepID=UPI00301C9EDC
MRGNAFDWLVLAVLVVIWGSSFAALKVATTHIDPAWNTAGRIAIASATLAVALVLQRQRLPPLRHPAWRAYAVIGFFGMAFPFVLFAYASQQLPSAVVAICNGASPIFTALLAHLFVADDRLSWRKAFGVGLGFAGLVTLAAPRLVGGVTVEAAAVVAALSGAALYAVANIATRRAPEVSSTAGALMMCVWALVFALAAAPLLDPVPAAWPPWPAVLAVAVLGVFSTGLATVGYVFLIQRRGPLFMSMSIYLAPCLATALGMAALGERPGWPAFAALALILTGVGFVTWTSRHATPS